MLDCTQRGCILFLLSWIVCLELCCALFTGHNLVAAVGEGQHSLAAVLHAFALQRAPGSGVAGDMRAVFNLLHVMFITFHFVLLCSHCCGTMFDVMCAPVTSAQTQSCLLGGISGVVRTHGTPPGVCRGARCVPHRVWVTDGGLPSSSRGVQGALGKTTWAWTFNNCWGCCAVTL